MATRELTEREVTPELLALARIAQQGEDLIIECDGERLAVLVGIERYDEIVAWHRERAFDVSRELHERNKDEDPDEVDRFVLAEIQQMRREQGV